MTVGGCQSVILNEESPEGAVIKLGEYDRIPMYTIAMPPFFPYKVAAPDILYLKKMLIGLLETFPTYSQDFFMYYLYTKEGVQTHYTIAQLAKIALKKSEKPVAGETNRSNWICNESSDSSDKENISAYSNKVQFNKIASEKLVISKPLNYVSPNSQQIVRKDKFAGILPKKSKEFHTIDKVKSSFLEQIEEEGIYGHPMFYTEERSDSLNDEDYEYTQLNTSTLKELSDLGKESSMDDKTAQNNTDKEERVSYIMESDLFCAEDINQFFQSQQ